MKATLSSLLLFAGLVMLAAPSTAQLAQCDQINFPPDDTASNLNPGDPNDEANIQDPAVHGSINLGALFQIPSEGPE